MILILNKKGKRISEQNLRQTRRSPQSIMDIYGQGLQRSRHKFCRKDYAISIKD